MSFSKIYVGNSVGEFAYSNASSPITGVRVFIYDDTYVLVGTEDNAIDVNIYTCTDTSDAEAYGQYILSALSGWQYQPYQASDAPIDPAYTLGDGITVRGKYSTIFKRTTSLNDLVVASASAPYEEEIDHEYQFIPSETRKEDRRYHRLVDSIESEFSIQAGLISAKVSKVSPDGQTSFSWDMDDTSHVWYASGTEVFRLDATGAHVKGEITAYSGVIGDCVIENGVLKVKAANVESLSIGSNFSVDVNGNMKANNAVITGTLKVGNSYISANDLYTGASQSALNHSSWSGTTSTVNANGYDWSMGGYYGYSGVGSFYNSSQYGSSSYQSYFNCGQMNHHNAYMTYNGHILQLLSIYVGSTQYYFLGYIP